MARAGAILDRTVIRTKIIQKEFKLITVNLALQKYRSPIWSFFKQISDRDKNIIVNFVCCPTCKSVIAFNSAKHGTSNLARHKCYVQYRSSNPITDNQQSINRATSNDILRKMSTDTKSLLRQGEVAFVARDLRPMSAVEGVGLHALLSVFTMIGAAFGTVRPDVCKELIAVGSTVSRHVKKLAVKLKDRLVEHLSSSLRTSGCAMTTDIWKDEYTKRSYLSLTVHYVNNASLFERVLATHNIPYDQRHTGNNIRQILIDILNRFKLRYLIDEVTGRIVFVSDRGPNVLNALSETESITCFAYLLNNVVELMCTIIEGKDSLLEHARKLVSYFKTSGLNAELKTSLKPDVYTRWNTIHDMLNSILVNWDGVVTILINKDAYGMLEKISKAQIECIVEFLYCFSQATDEVEQSKRPSLCLAQPWYNMLTAHMQMKDTDLECINEMKKIGLEYFETHFVLTKYHQSAIVLHPHLKHLDSVVEEMDRSVIKYQVIDNAMRYKSTTVVHMIID